MINDYDPKEHIINVRDVIFSWVAALAFVGTILFFMSLY